MMMGSRSRKTVGSAHIGRPVLHWHAACRPEAHIGAAPFIVT